MGIFKKLVRKVQVPTEPDLTTAELMLTNSDLQPGALFYVGVYQFCTSIFLELPFTSESSSFNLVCEC